MHVIDMFLNVQETHDVTHGQKKKIILVDTQKIICRHALKEPHN